MDDLFETLLKENTLTRYTKAFVMSTNTLKYEEEKIINKKINNNNNNK
jgi:hypothetical protein